MTWSENVRFREAYKTMNIINNDLMMSYDAIMTKSRWHQNLMREVELKQEYHNNSGLIQINRLNFVNAIS